MRKLFIALAIATLPACAPFAALGALGTPASYANKTVIDEQVGITAELEYKAFTVAIEAAVNAGLVKPGSAKALQLAKIDNTAYAELQLVRKAYEAGNATSYNSAVQQTAALLYQGYNILKGK